jgi:lipopolysaccharide/colanic/teichoic acid biosynthesis glycosyltransferase
VLRGEMSLVGPRPERPELLEPTWRTRSRCSRSACATSSPASPGLAQISLGYTGEAAARQRRRQAGRHAAEPVRPRRGASGALADDMRIKLLYDLAYTASMEDLHRRILQTELSHHRQARRW